MVVASVGYRLIFPWTVVLMMQFVCRYRIVCTSGELSSAVHTNISDQDLGRKLRSVDWAAETLLSETHS